MNRQHWVDSFLEALVNQGFGFIIAWATYIFVINPLFGLRSSPGESFLITAIFAVSSMLRSFLVRRLFDGRTVYEGLRARYFQPKEKHCHD